MITPLSHYIFDIFAEDESDLNTLEGMFANRRPEIEKLVKELALKY
jgi:hypothetical protein